MRAVIYLFVHQRQPVAVCHAALLHYRHPLVLGSYVLLGNAGGAGKLIRNFSCHAYRSPLHLRRHPKSSPRVSQPYRFCLTLPTRQGQIENWPVGPAPAHARQSNRSRCSNGPPRMTLDNDSHDRKQREPNPTQNNYTMLAKFREGEADRSEK